MYITGDRVIVFFLLVFGIPVLTIALGALGKWIITNYEDWFKKFLNVLGILFFLVLYLVICILIAFGFKK